MISKIALTSALSVSLALVSPGVYAIKDPATETNSSAPLASAHLAASSGSESESVSHSYTPVSSQADDIREVRASLARMEAALKQEYSDNVGLRYFQHWAGSIATVSLVLLVILQAASHIR